MTTIEAVKQTRKIAADTCFDTLKSVYQSNTQISEVAFRDAWLKNLRKHPEIFPSGWYDPPPNGIAVRFATDKNFGDLYLPNLRPKENWPREDAYLDIKNGMAYVYASPVSKSFAGMMGDWGMTIYFGQDPQIRKHIQFCLSVNRAIYESIKLGMPFNQVYSFAIDLLDQAGFKNNVTSITDPRNQNIGHTFPGSYENWTKKEAQLLKMADQRWTDIIDILKNKRKFLSPVEDFLIRPNMAFSIEPRPVSKTNNLPTVSFHTVVLIDKNGKKDLLSEYSRIFRLVGMNYMLN